MSNPSNVLIQSQDKSQKKKKQEVLASTELEAHGLCFFCFFGKYHGKI